MKLPLYQVDAFANKIFEGNPAAICPLDSWLDDELMQAIAAENNLSETAFYVATEQGYHIRWFTPLYEVDLCGHATLAAAHIIFTEFEFDKSEIMFSSKSGVLSVVKNGDYLEMNFPAQPAKPCDLPEELNCAFGIKPVVCLKSQDYILVFDSEDVVHNANPDMACLEALDLRGVVITARVKNKKSELDFISRFFAPKYGIKEDPVTGSSFTQLTPYWSKKLDKMTMKARQVSRRGGDVTCVYDADRVRISGKAITYMLGSINI